RGRGFASLYSQCASLFDGAAGADAHAMEVLAHLGRGDRVDELSTVFRYVDGALEVAPDWRAQLHQMIRAERQQHGHARETASAIQRRLGERRLVVGGEAR